MINFVEIDIVQNEIRGRARDVAIYRTFYEDYLNQITFATANSEDFRTNTGNGDLQYTPIDSIIRLREICQLSVPQFSPIQTMVLDQSLDMESQ